MAHDLVKIIVETLGSEAIEQRIGVSGHAVRKAKSDGFFSGLWYAPLKEMCETAGADCPIEAFRFKDAEKGAA